MNVTEEATVEVSAEEAIKPYLRGAITGVVGALAECLEHHRLVTIGSIVIAAPIIFYGSRTIARRRARTKYERKQRVQIDTYVHSNF